MKIAVFPGELGLAVCVGEASFHVARLAGVHAGNPGDESGNEAPLGKLGDLALGGAALEGFIIDPALVVERYDVSGLRGPLDGHEGRPFFGQRLEAALDVVVCDGDGRSRHG